MAIRIAVKRFVFALKKTASKNIARVYLSSQLVDLILWTVALAYNE